jgi:glycosyltransferase involved in cell wall biosynthesis
MPTRRARRWSVLLSLQCFLRQQEADGIESELVIVDDAPDGEQCVGGVYDLVDQFITNAVLDDRLTADQSDRIVDSIRYVALTTTPPNAGAKWNAAIAQAEGDWVALWADDDWHAYDRVKKTIATIRHGGSVDMVGDNRMLIHELVYPRRTFQFTYPKPSTPPVYGETAYFAGGTLAVRKSFALKHPMPELVQGCDTDFCVNSIWKHNARWRYIDDAYLTVATRHHENTGNTITPNGDSFWEPWQGDLRRLTDGAIDQYAINWGRRDKI